MSLITLTSDLLKPYFSGDKKHKAYEETVKIYNRLRIHADGETPTEILEKQRPSEDDVVFKFRQSIWEPVTSEAVSRILNCLNRIRKSRDWSITFKEEDIPAKVGGNVENTLKHYTEVAFPFFESITNWFFDVCLRHNMVDPNAVVLVMPMNPLETDDSIYKKPFPFIFNTPQVFEYRENELLIVLSSDLATYTTVNGVTKYDGKVFYVVNTMTIYRYEQINASGDMAEKWRYDHKLNYLPAFKLGGHICKTLDSTFIYKSRIDSIVPRLNLIVGEFSDLQAEVVQHIHSDKWVYQSKACTACQKTGIDLDYICPEGQICPPQPCKTCHGDKYISVSPYKTMVVNPLPNTEGANSIPIPPAGYIQKQVEIVKIQDERIEKHFFYAYSTIELQHLAQTPLNTSGTSKEVDRDSQNMFVHGVAEGGVRIIDRVMKIINDMRFSGVVPDPKLRAKMLPSISVPEKFDILGYSYLVGELKSAKDAAVNPVVIREMEIELAGKQFAASAKLQTEHQLVLSLDPLFGLTDDQKDSRLRNKGITLTDYVISSNIAPFVSKALEANSEFATLPKKEQQALLVTYAKEVMDENSNAQQTADLIAVPPAA